MKSASAAAAAQQYGCGLYILTVQDYTEYAAAGSDPFDFAMSVYSRYDLGVGEERNGLLLVLSMEDRDYAICAYGNGAHTAFTDYGKEQLEAEFLDNFAADDWYGGFSDYLAYGTEYLRLAAAGTPVDWVDDGSDWADGDSPWAVDGSGYYREGPTTLQCFLFIFLIPAGIALVVCLILKGKMKTAREQVNANEYIRPNGMTLLQRIDQYTHTTETRVRIESQQSSGGGGHHGGTTINSSGFSGHSGKF